MKDLVVRCVIWAICERDADSCPDDGKLGAQDLAGWETEFPAADSGHHISSSICNIVKFQ